MTLIAEVRARLARIASLPDREAMMALGISAPIDLSALCDRIEALEAALRKIADFHLDQADAWDDSEGDPDIRDFHREREQFARAALGEPTP